MQNDKLDADMQAMVKDEMHQLEEKQAVYRRIENGAPAQRSNDEKNIIMEIRAGAGGDEQQFLPRPFPYV